MNAPAAIDITTTDWTCFDVTIEDNVAHIALNRPEAFNTMPRAFWNELPAIVRDIDDNARARVHRHLLDRQALHRRHGPRRVHRRRGDRPTRRPGPRTSPPRRSANSCCACRTASPASTRRACR